MISIIVTVYNLEKYISDCLESIRKQTLTNFEVIIINDGSTDNSEKIINEFICGDERFKLFNTENKGVSEARNTALELSSGEYILFVDGDDMITEDCLSTCMRSIRDNDIIVFNYKKLDAAGVASNTRYNASSLKNRNIDTLCIEAIELEPNPWGKFYKSSIFMNIKYPKGLLYEDYAIFYKLFKGRKVDFIDDELYVYRIRNGSIMRSFDRRRIDDKKIILTELYNDLRDQEADEIKKAYINSYLFHFVFVTFNVICNSSKAPLRDGKALKSAINKKYFTYSNILSSGSLNSTAKVFLVLIKFSVPISFMVKKLFSWVKK